MVTGPKSQLPQEPAGRILALPASHLLAYASRLLDTVDIGALRIQNIRLKHSIAKQIEALENELLSLGKGANSPHHATNAKVIACAKVYIEEMQQFLKQYDATHPFGDTEE